MSCRHMGRDLRKAGKLKQLLGWDDELESDFFFFLNAFF